MSKLYSYEWLCLKLKSIDKVYVICFCIDIIDMLHVGIKIIILFNKNG